MRITVWKRCCGNCAPSGTSAIFARLSPRIRIVSGETAIATSPSQEASAGCTAREISASAAPITRPSNAAASTCAFIIAVLIRGSKQSAREAGSRDTPHGNALLQIRASQLRADRRPTLQRDFGMRRLAVGGSSLSGTLFDALLCCHRCAESGEGALQQAVRINCWCQQRHRILLIWCSGPIFGLSCRNAGELRLWVAEHVGVG